MSVRIGVVVPCRDEEALLPRCLAHLDAAVARYPGEARVVVVLDRCSDGSAAVAARWPRFETLVGGFGGVGAARAAGARLLLPWAEWLCSTDADSAVPPTWLRVHAMAAEAGIDVLQGNIRPDLTELSEAEKAEWRARGATVDPLVLIYGANLGIAAPAYESLGGFAPHTSDEDVDIVTRARLAGMRVQQTDAAPVLTSARDHGRVEGGFATYIEALRRSVRDASGRIAG